MKIKLLNFTISLLVLLLIFSCGKSNFEENKELNLIISAIVQRENKFNTSTIYINDSLKQLKIYIPSREEIEEKIPPPPPGKTTSIIRLLDFRKNYTQEDSILVLKQNNYPLKKIEIDSEINSELKIANPNNKKERKLSFSTPIYFTNDFVYLEVGYYDYGFSRGTAYLLKKENGKWKMWNEKPLWIS